MITDFNRLPFTNVDCSPCPRSPLCHYFNPLPSARGDAFLNYFKPTIPISIHSPLRGETICNFPVTLPSKFQSTSLFEGRLPRLCILSQTDHFNPLPSARGDRWRHLCPRRTDFNPLPSARGDAGRPDHQGYML